jgi:acyl-CoA-binding protein
MAVDDEFEKAQEQVKTLKSRPSNETLLDLYSLFKQGTAGDVEGKRPGMLDLKGRAKFDAWTSRRGMGREAARKAYAELVKRLLVG